MIMVKILLVLSLFMVFLQDFKERQVYWFLFPIIGILSGLLFYRSTLPELFYASIIVNTVFVSLLIFILFIYSKFKLKTRFFSAIGLGDLFLFLVLSVSFSSVSFVVIFTGALIFSLILHLLLTKVNKTITVPLAGYISLFFLISYVCHWAGFINAVYTI